MTPRPVFAALAVLALVAPAGCRVKKTTAATWVPPVPTSYLQYNLIDLKALVGIKMGVEVVTLNADGPNHYAGTVKLADGTVLPLTVTVEDQRVVAEARSPAGGMRQIITPTESKTDLDIK